MSNVGVTIAGQPFAHLVYHFVLTHSNWEHVTVCFAESFASLSAGLQNALWALGGVPARHRTDRMTLAVHADGQAERFTPSYRALPVPPPMNLAGRASSRTRSFSVRLRTGSGNGQPCFPCPVPHGMGSHGLRRGCRFHR